MKDDNLEKLKKYFEENGIKSSKFINNNHKNIGLPSASYYIITFGCWKKVIELMGFEYSRKFKRKKEKKPKIKKTNIKFGYKFTPEEYDTIEESIKLAKSKHKTFTKAFYEICKFYLENKEDK